MYMYMYNQLIIIVVSSVWLVTPCTCVRGKVISRVVIVIVIIVVVDTKIAKSADLGT